MCRLILWVILCVLVVGCQQQRIYEIDFSQSPGFQWDRKVRITKASHPRFGPLLSVEDNWQVDRVEFVSRDGRSASIDAHGYNEVPLATLDLGTPTALEILGTRGYWDGSHSNVVIMDPDSVRTLISGLDNAATQPASSCGNDKFPVRSVSEELKPYAGHVDQLGLADWWAIALERADDVSIEFRVPEERLRITLRGDPRQFGPSILEVRTDDGRLLKRFERKPVLVEELRAAKARADSQPATNLAR